jgi:acetyl-CoA acetyltransferase
MVTGFEDVVIAGVAETKLGKLPGRFPVDLQAEAVLLALEDAGLERERLDGLVNLDPYVVPESMFAQTVAEYLGVSLKMVQTVDVGGTVSSMRMLQTAAWAIATGECEAVVCVSGENTLTARQSGRGLQMHNRMAGHDWEEPIGVRGMVIPYALLAQKYFDIYGDATEALAEIALTARRHALLHENALMRKPLTREAYFASRMISTPLRLNDCSLVSDGAGAVLLTSKRLTKELKLKKAQVTVSGLGVEFTHASVVRMPEITGLGARLVVERAMRQAGVGIKDIDVAMIHDAFTISVLIGLEATGLCPVGQGRQYILSEGIGLDSPLPVNTHGGLLSHAHIGGITLMVEAVRQLWGECGPRQVKDAKRVLVSGNGGIFSVCGALVLERIS